MHHVTSNNIICLLTLIVSKNSYMIFVNSHVVIQMSCQKLCLNYFKPIWGGGGLAPDPKSPSVKETAPISSSSSSSSR